MNYGVSLGTYLKKSGIYSVAMFQSNIIRNRSSPVGDGFGLFVYFDRYENTYFPNGVIKRPESKPRGPRKKKIGK